MVIHQLKRETKMKRTVARDKVTAEQGILMDHLNIPISKNN